MFTWLQANVIPVLFCTITSLVAALAIMFSMWQGAEHDAQVQRALVTAQAHIITAQDNVVRAEHTTTRVVEHTVERIMETPHANDPFPPDVASAWSDGIDCLRTLNSPRTSASTSHVQGPCTSEAVSGSTDKRPASNVQ